MVSLFDDQAAGLRKLFSGGRGPTTVAFAGPAGAPGGAGRNALVAGLARGLAAAGKEILVIDEHAGANGVAAAFGLRSRYDLLQAVNRDVPAARVLLQAEASIRLLPAARAARQYARLGAMERQALGEWLRRLQKGVDFVLVDTVERDGTDGSPLLPQPQRTIVAASPDGASITEAYAQMKRLAQARDCRRFGIVILQAASLAEGRTVFANLCEVAHRHLGADLELLGCQTGRSDPHSVGHALADSFLDSSRKPAARSLSVIERAAQGASAAYPVV